MTSTYTDRIQGVQTSVALKAPCRVATTANIALTGVQAIDGVTIAAGDRVLVKNQTDPVDNGIWIASASAWTRAIDFNGARDVVKGTRVFVTDGTANGAIDFIVTTAMPVVGASSIVFRSESRTAQDTVADLQAAADLVIGDVVETRSYDSNSAFGGNLYDMVAGGTYTADGGSVIDCAGSGLQAVGRFPDGIIRAEQFGVTLGAAKLLVERSAQFNAAFAYAAQRAAVYEGDDGQSTETTPRGATFSCSTDFLAKDPLCLTYDGTTTGANAENMTINWTGFVFATTGGVLATHTQTRPIPLVFQKLRYSTINWPSLNCEHICAGIKEKVDTANKHHGLRLNGFSRYGLWKVTNNDSPHRDFVIKQFTRDADLVQNGVAHSDFSEWHGDCIVVSTKDFAMDALQLGWSGPCIRLLDTMPTDPAQRIPGQNCYWCGLESANGYVDGDNGSGDCIFNNVHMMQGLKGDGSFISAGSGTRTGYYADYNFATGGMIIRQVDTPIGILSFCKVSNPSFFNNLDNDNCNHYLFGSQVSIRDETPNSASAPRCSLATEVQILDPRIRVFASRGGAGAQRYPFMFSQYDQRNMTVGYYDNPAEIYWNGSALVEASTAWNGSWAAWNQINSAHGTGYSGQVKWRGFLAAGTHSPSVNAAGDHWTVQGSATINPGSVSATDGQLVYALVASPAGSSDWLVVGVGAAPARVPNNFTAEVLSHRMRVYSAAANSSLPAETWHIATDFFQHDYIVNGTKVSQIKGFGLPEGNVTANPGSHYYDLTAKFMWEKRTGTGTSGWRNTDRVNVRSFGAVADGNTSDVAAANACIAFAMNTKAIAYFPSGEYAFDASVNAYPAVTGGGDNRFWPVAIEGDNPDTTVFVVKSSDPTIDILNLNNGTSTPSNARYYRSVKKIGFKIHADHQSATTHPRYLNLGALWNGVIHDVFFAESRSTHMTGTRMSNLDVQNVSSSKGSIPFIYKDTTGITLAGSAGANNVTASGSIFSLADVGKTLTLSAVSGSPEQYTIWAYNSPTNVTIVPNLVAAHTTSLFMFDPPRVTGSGTTITAEADCFVAAHVGVWIWITSGRSATGGSVYARIEEILAPNQIRINKTLGATIGAPGVYFHNASIEITDEGGSSNDVILNTVRVFHHSGVAFAGRDIRNLSITESKWHGDGNTDLNHYSAAAMVLDLVEGSFSGVFGQRVMCPFRVYFLKQQDRDFFIPLLFTGVPTNAKIFSLADFNGNGTVKVGIVSSGTTNWWDLATDANSTPRMKVTGMGNYKSSYTMTVSDGTTAADIKTVNYSVSDSTVSVYLSFANNIDVSTLLATTEDLRFSLPFPVLYNSFQPLIVKQLAAGTGPYWWYAKAGESYAHIYDAGTQANLKRSDFNTNTTDITGGTLIYLK